MQADCFWQKYIELGFVNKDTSDDSRTTPFTQMGRAVRFEFFLSQFYSIDIPEKF
jgi:hypothetical protein